jgi:DNA-binding NarL/FixJ family response regulator
VRAGFQALLASEEDIAMVGEAGDGDEAVALAKHARPDVMLVASRFPASTGSKQPGESSPSQRSPTSRC